MLWYAEMVDTQVDLGLCFPLYLNFPYSLSVIAHLHNDFEIKIIIKTQLGIQVFKSASYSMLSNLFS